MSTRSDYLLSFIERLGMPLFTASSGEGAGTPEEEARAAAELLSRAVQLSIDLGRITAIEKAEPDRTDALRVGLAALAGDLVAAQKKILGRMPAEADLKRIGGVIEVILSFSESFAPEPALTQTLANLPARGQAVSAEQAGLQYLHAFLPVIEAVGRFTFGQQDKILVRDVAARLSTETQTLRQTIFPPSGDAAEDRRIERSLLSVLAALYAAAHNEEIDRFGKAGPNDPPPNLATVWTRFETRLAMLAALAEGISPGRIIPKTAPIPAGPTPPDSNSNPLSMFAKKPGASSESPPTPPTSPPSTENGTAGPMGFFKKPPGADGQETPPLPPPPAPPPTPPAPPSADEGKKQEDQEGKGGDDESGGGGPMSFFKKK